MAATSVRADISGTVLDASASPVAGAIVSVQATALRTTTAADGSFNLTVADGSDLVIVGAKKGLFNAGVIVDAPASAVVIVLDAVPQDDDPSYTPMPPSNCGACHPNQLQEWLNTPMADAGLNAWVHDIFSGTGTPGGMGGFVYLNDSIFAASNPASECAACHQPEVWMESPFSAMEGPTERGYPSTGVVHGIACDTCHKIADINVDNINYPGIFPGFGTLTRPQGPNYHQVQYGVLGDSDYSIPTVMRSSYQPQLISAVCGACHQDKNDIHEDHTFDGVTSEPTYIEWLESPYSDPNSPHYASCVDCHMPPSGETEASSVLFPPLIRDPQTIRSHTILGTTPQFLENAVELEMTAGQSGDSLEVDVMITNAHTGHHVPTGVTIRNMILLVEAWREDTGAPLISTSTQTVHELGGVGDPNQGYYAGQPGKYYSKVNHNAQGNGPTFFTDATGIQFDNRIPALGSDETHYQFALPAEGGVISVRARLIYRRSFRFLTDAKGWVEDGHGNPLADVSPPHFGHLMESSVWAIEAEPTITIAQVPTLAPTGMAVLTLLFVAGLIGLHLRSKRRGRSPNSAS
jgi:hypothetical protein